VREMAEMSGRKRVEAALNFESVDRVPVYPLIHFATARVAGYKISEFATDGKKMAKSLISAYRTYGYDGVHPGVDVSVEGEAVGSKLRQPEDATAFLIDPVLKDPNDLEKLKVPDPYKDGRMPVIIEATKICDEEIGSEAFVSAWIMGPLNCASQIRGVEPLMLDMIERPQFVHKLLDFCVDVLTEFGGALVDAGALMINMGEAICSPNFISPRMYRDIVVPHQKKLVEKLKKKGASYTLLHICGDIHPILEYTLDTGASLLDIDWQVNIKRMINQIDNKIAARGNLNPAGTLLLGTPEEVMTECQKLIEDARGWNGFILGSGCDVARDTPPENIKAMVLASKKYS